VAQRMKKTEVTTTAPSTNKKQPTASEVREFYEKNKNKLDALQRYEIAQTEGVRYLRDVSKTGNRNISSFSKEVVRNYLKSPGTNEKNLRSLSRYLFYRSHIYFRLLKFFANCFCLDVRSVIPEYDLVKGGDATKTLKSFNETVDIVDRMGLQREMLAAILMALREDVAYYCVFYDETGMFLMNLDPDYCRIDGRYSTGDFSFSMDMTFWRNKQDVLDALGSPLREMYDEYDRTGNKWQHMQDEYAFCLKFRNEDYDLVIPPFCAMFLDLISLLDLAEIQAISDEQQIYKLVYLPMDTIGEDVDDWMVSPDLVLDYFNRMLDSGAIPDYTSSAVIPGKELKTISFDNDATTDVNRLQKATTAILDTSGGSELLMGSNISGSTAFQAAMISNTEFAISSILPQIESFVQRFISYQIKNPGKIRFFPVSVYTKKDFQESLLKSAEYGLPTKLIYNACNGFSAKDTMSLNFLEESCLNLGSLFVPLQSTHTQSGSATGDEETGGRPKNETPTDESEASEAKRDANN